MQLGVQSHGSGTAFPCLSLLLSTWPCFLPSSAIRCSRWPHTPKAVVFLKDLLFISNVCLCGVVCVCVWAPKAREDIHALEPDLEVVMGQTQAQALQCHDEH